MILDLLINPVEAEKRPWQMFILGILFATIGVFLGLYVWREQSSLMMVFITVLCATPITYNTIRLEEKKDEAILEEPRLLREHMKALSVFMYIFFGVTLAYVLWYFVLPHSLTSHLFLQQHNTLTLINGSLTNITGNATSFGIFSKIFFNNIKVLFLCIIFSFIYGIGGMFILIWNASVLSAAIVDFITENISLMTTSSIGGYIWYSIASLFRYFTHGFFEILAYFIAALAGGLISIAVIKHRMFKPSFERIMFDSMQLIIIAVLLTVFAGLIEVYISPNLTALF